MAAREALNQLLQIKQQGLRQTETLSLQQLAEAWRAKRERERLEREGTLRGLERQADNATWVARQNWMNQNDPSRLHAQYELDHPEPGRYSPEAVRHYWQTSGANRREPLTPEQKPPSLPEARIIANNLMPNAAAALRTLTVQRDAAKKIGPSRLSDWYAGAGPQFDRAQSQIDSTVGEVMKRPMNSEMNRGYLPVNLSQFAESSSPFGSVDDVAEAYLSETIDDSQAEDALRELLNSRKISQEDYDQAMFRLGYAGGR